VFSTTERPDDHLDYLQTDVVIPASWLWMFLANWCVSCQLEFVFALASCHVLHMLFVRWRETFR
jgi:hypothetical protein